MGLEASHDRHHVCQVEGETAPEKVCRHLGCGGRGVQDAAGEQYYTHNYPPGKVLQQCVFFVQVETALSIAERLLSIGEICRSGKRVKDLTQLPRKEDDDSDSDSDQLLGTI